MCKSIVLAWLHLLALVHASTNPGDGQQGAPSSPAASTVASATAQPSPPTQGPVTSVQQPPPAQEPAAAAATTSAFQQADSLLEKQDLRTPVRRSGLLSNRKIKGKSMPPMRSKQPLDASGNPLSRLDFSNLQPNYPVKSTVSGAPVAPQSTKSDSNVPKAPSAGPPPASGSSTKQLVRTVSKPTTTSSNAPPKEKDSQLAGLSLTLNFVKKDAGSSDEDEPGDEKSKLLATKDQHGPEAEMVYHDLLSRDGTINQKTIKIIGLTNQGQGVFDNPQLTYTGNGFMAPTTAQIYIPPTQQRKRHGPHHQLSSSDLGVGAQLQNAANVFAGMNSSSGVNTGGLFAGSGSQSTVQRRGRNRGAANVQQSESQNQLPDGAVVYVNVGGQVIAVPVNHPEDEDSQDDEDELENHYLVQAFARNGKERVVAMNLIRLWRILAILLINLAVFFGLNFGAISNINVALNNSAL